MLQAYFLAVLLAGSPEKPPVINNWYGPQHERVCHIERAELQKKLDREPVLKQAGATAVCLVVTLGEQV